MVALGMSAGSGAECDDRAHAVDGSSGTSVTFSWIRMRAG
jgi:hypothetical protein